MSSNRSSTMTTSANLYIGEVGIPPMLVLCHHTWADHAFPRWVGLVYSPFYAYTKYVRGLSLVNTCSRVVNGIYSGLVQLATPRHDFMICNVSI